MSLTPAERLELDRLVEEQATDLEWLSRVEQYYPLAASVLWTHPNPSTGWDQRRSVVAAMTCDRVQLVKGGWRSGKSEGLKQLTVAMALGGDHEMVQRWLELNDLPQGYIPDGPQQVYAIAQSSNDSLRYHRDDFDRLTGSLPKVWSNRNAKGEASLTLQVPGYAKKGRIWFKSVDQTRKAMQGISIRYAFIDEEPTGDIGWGVYDELRARVADQEGRIGIAYVPMDGITWLHDRLERDREDGAGEPVQLDPLDNPHLPESFRRLYESMTEDEIQVRRFGRYRSRSGSVYAWVGGDGDRDGPGHMCNDFEVPVEWPRFRGADWGLVNPTCVLWAALGDDDTLYVYDEYYRGNGESYDWHAVNVLPMDHGQSIQAGWADPSEPKAIAAFATHRIRFSLANNDVKAGIDAVRDVMRLRSGRPRLKVFRSCANLLRELPAYSWDPNRRDEYPLKRDDHSCDALRYLVMGVDEWRGDNARRERLRRGIAGVLARRG